LDLRRNHYNTTFASVTNEIPSIDYVHIMRHQYEKGK
jgi:hypothetical protein